MSILWKKSDFDATMGVFFDGFTKIIIAVAALSGVLSSNVLYGRVMVGVSLSLCALHIYFWYTGEKMKQKTGIKDYVAIPGGVSAYRFFIYLFAIFFVVLGQQGPETALKVTIMANLIGSIVFILGAWIVPILMKVIPGGAIFGALAGASLAFLGINVVQNSLTAMPIVGFITSFIIFTIYLGNIKTKLPAVLIAIIVGIVMAWVGVFIGLTPESVVSVEGITSSLDSLSLYIPIVSFDFLSGEVLSLTLPFLPLIIAFGIGDVVNVILGLKQAKAVGHHYNEKEVIFMVGLFSLFSAFLGNPFPFAVFFGYNTWKEINAGTAYSLATGGIYLLLGVTGAFALFTSIIPTAAVGGILVFIALVSTAQTFETSDVKHYSAIALALIIPIIEVIVTLMGEHASDLVPGLVPLAQGSTLTAIIWATALIFIIDNKWIKAGYSFAAALILSSIGLIHAPQISWLPNIEYTLIYFVLIIMMIGLSLRFSSKVNTKNKTANS